MLISEMHIALEQELDSININVEDNIDDEQKDYFLNREIIHFVKTRVRSLPITGNVGLDDIMKRLVDVETLIEREELIPGTIIDGDVEATLPPFCFYPVAVGASVCCDLTVATESVEKNIAIVPFKRDESLWEGFSILADRATGVQTLFDIADYPPYENGMQDTFQDYVLLDLVMREVNTLSDMKVYWQYYKGTFYPNKLIFVSDTIDADIQMKYLIEDDVYNFEDSDNIRYVDNSCFTKKSSRIYSLEFIRQNIDTSFNTTFAHSPLSSINKNLIHLYTKKKFIIRDSYLTYVRTPQIVSLSLNNSCDLPDAIHDEIVKLTARSIKAIIDSSNYEKTLTETSLIN